MLSRRVGGFQQIKLAITFHTAGEQILWPYGYTRTDVPSDMTRDDHAALVALGKRLASRNGYTAMQSSSLYVTDGDEIDWAYGSQRIWMYTIELYPSHSKVSSLQRFYPADELIARETERNKSAILYFIEQACCRYSVIGLTRENCGPLFDDFETPHGWKADPLGTDTATARRLAAGEPRGHHLPGRDRAVRLAGAGHGLAAGRRVERERRRRRRDHGPLAGGHAAGDHRRR